MSNWNLAVIFAWIYLHDSQFASWETEDFLQILQIRRILDLPLERLEKSQAYYLLANGSKRKEPFVYKTNYKVPVFSKTSPTPKAIAVAELSMSEAASEAKVALKVAEEWLFL